MTPCRFLSSPAGRIFQIVDGLILTALGIILGGPWWILVPIGLVPLLAGALGVCLLAPFVKDPERGRDLS